MNIDRAVLASELIYQMSRSSGKGGQNVNKVATKVEVGFSIEQSQLFSNEEKERLLQKLSGRITKDGLIKITSEEERSQLMNKHRVIEKLAHILENALKIEKPRRATKPSKASKEKRLKNKQLTSIKKINRTIRGWE
ncbi:alternative ribosome rescue aminoacyl-tRNA hydrolase ArfB [Solitalea canadensis]|uniref:Protein chain release factor B n=1 Tax=Solitalea canadensis (strain ATCC 29591 / DSM 3403 / JCM 21819 / LMG 8368 / NBRC 15130 / NCIMB 12057 / USAM 9D) TaxID=929556 RepID=H8KPA9_SOLCM|nr:alternative ribosome rescue aminoacyl-tRNA hydrolase ArfB [Solitalea canadensis]AFD05807.1 protein chain release factor B [Solitalea canadensis DSM 3403]